MRHLLLVGLCVCGAACNSLSSSTPTGPTGAGAMTSSQTQAATAGRPVEVTFTKWIATPPQMAGFTGGDIPGTYAGTLLRRTPTDNGALVALIRLRGHLPKGGYDVPHVLKQGWPAYAPAVL
jgi:hypothetical protein